MLKKIKSNAGVTMVELVIVLAIMGILSVTVIPMYSQMQAKSQATRNRANMEIIKDAFLNHFYHTYSMGTPSVPTPPDSLMTDEWCNSPMDSTRGTKTPNDLFGSGEVPKNSNNVPFLYRSWIETKSCLLYTSPSPRDAHESRMPSSA